ncbi:MAG: peptidylprolyl isomerase, partial [Gallionellaceae bacterium]|nr:peptidylprolyl isomerase [Gallionellaceae bacterium]
MKKAFKLALFAVLGAVGVTTVHAASVNGIPVPQDRIDAQVKDVLARAPQQKDTPELRKAITGELIGLEVLSQEATRLGLDKDTNVRMALDMSRQNVLANALIADRVKNTKISEDALKKEYEAAKTSLGTKEYNVRHILVEKEADAKNIVAQLRKTPGDFDRLAKSQSNDAGSKANGGDLGWIPANNIPGTFVQPFADATMKLKKGDISEPVQSQFGWHIIKLQDIRDLKMPTLDEIRPQLTQRLQQQAVQSYVGELRSKAKIVE